MYTLNIYIYDKWFLAAQIISLSLYLSSLSLSLSLSLSSLSLSLSLSLCMRGCMCEANL